MPVSAETYERVTLEDPEGRWELACGRLVRKPIMTTEHADAARRLTRRLVIQLDEDEYSVGETVRLRVSSGSYRVPDVCVVPREYVRRLRERPGTFEVYDDAVPLVVEVWSPSTGDYDVEEKLRQYQQRGDLEIWRIHPYDRTLTAWRRQSDDSYTQTLYRGGAVESVALPNVVIEIDRLFD